MSIRVYFNQVRTLIAFAPLIAQGMLVCGALNGEPEMLLWRNAHLVIAPLALLGWWTARGLGSVLKGLQVSRIGSALPGYVALQGIARPLPNRAPLVSPSSGTRCVWFHFRESRSTNSYTGPVQMYDSDQPFLLADDTGECIVDIAGVEISGVREDKSRGNYERLILSGDQLFIVGQLKPHYSPAQAADKGRQRAVVRKEFDHKPTAAELKELEEKFEKERDEAERNLQNLPPLPDLPAISMPEDSRPFLISTGAIQEEGGWYMFLSYFNLIAALGSISVVAYLYLAGQ